jgi:hypothetical protein
MMIWHMLRLAAIARHRVWWHTVESGNPEKWPDHMRMVRSVYGY